MPQSPTPCFQHMVDSSDQVNREESAAAATASMMRVAHRHVLDGGALKPRCTYPCRCGPLLLSSDRGEWHGSPCRVAKVMSRDLIVGIAHDDHDLGNRLM